MSLPGFSRRTMLQTTLCGGVAFFIGRPRALALDTALGSAQEASREIWKRFIDTYDVLIDYTDLAGKYDRATAEECRDGKPNALAWWTPTENGSMFNGMYLDGVCARWRLTKSEEARTQARRLMKGLLFLASVGPAGFVARSVSTDGKTPYPMGSDDQTGPWFYGLWRYIQDGLASAEERSAIVEQFVRVARVLESTDWRMPCNDGAPAKFRGTFAGHSWQHAPRLLFVLKAAHQLTGDAHWDQLYQKMTRETGGEPARSRVQICADGMVFHNPKWRESWTGASSVTALRGLWEMETDDSLRQAYAQGLAASAKLAAGGIPLSAKFSNDSKSAFLSDWRVLNEWWQPQHTETEAVAVAERQSKELGRLSPRRYEEFGFVREPLFASWVVTLCPDRKVIVEQRDAITQTIAHYDYQRLYYSQFFPAEAAAYRLSEAIGATL